MVMPTESMKDYAMAGSACMDFAQKVRGGDIIVGGWNFGCGSSREQAPIALKGAGVGLILAKSFGRIFKRNCINIGLPAMIIDTLSVVKHGSSVRANLLDAVVYVGAGSERVKCKRLSESDLQTLAHGGLINKLREQLGNNKGNF